MLLIYALDPNSYCERIYVYDIIAELTIPANTLSNDPVTLDVALGEGLLKQVIINFRKGCRHYAKTALYYGGTQIAPRVNGQGYAYDNFNLFIYPNISLSHKHHFLTVKGWSDESLYSHVLQYMFTIDDSKQSDIAGAVTQLFG